MSKITYPFIEDKKGRKLHYVLRFAENTKNARTLFILHGLGFSDIPSSFKDPNWNVVCPLDNFGYKNEGSWFLGENGDFFVKDLMLQLIEYIKKETCCDRLYFWGSSMGGYAAILYGLLCGAEAVFANVPQIKLRNTQYTDDNISINNYLNFVLDRDFPHWIDLTSLLESTDKGNYPIFFITQTRFHPYNYLKEHIYYFINKCNEMEANYFLEIVPKVGHLMYRNVAESIKLLDEYQEDIENWLEKRKLYIDHKNKLIRVYRTCNDDNSIEIQITMNSDESVGEKDLLLSFSYECLRHHDASYYGLLSSPNQEIGFFKYIPTKPGIYKSVFTIPFPDNQQEYIEFSIREFYPKGKTKVNDIHYYTFKK
ncbi:alpha/beta hydrolase family protein [Glaesserella sp.]